MPITTMSHMWKILKVYTVTPAGAQRPVNHLNEWGGYSQRLEKPVFTAWLDNITFNKNTRTAKALVSDTVWSSTVGVNNQEYWLDYAIRENDAVAAFFVIHAVDVNASPRKVQQIDDDKVFVGQVVRDGTKTYIVGQPESL